MTLVLKYVARSDRGLVRSNNQDSVYAGPRLLALADGMGGYAGGEVASKVVIAAMAPLDDDAPGEDLVGQLREAVLAGNAAISELVADDPELEGMGTTLTAILFAGNRLGLVNIGDSRTYLMRGGTVTQITRDDSFVQSLIDEGRITAEEASSHPQRSLLLRAITGHEIVEPTLTVREARAGDRYLLCSDGLSSVISHETLSEALHISDLQNCADRMIELALKGGGPDNVTVIVADVVDIEFGEDAPIVGGAASDVDEQNPPAPDSPASRAGALNPPAPPPQRTEPSQHPPPVSRRHRVRRRLIITGVVLLVLAGAAIGTNFLVFSQYYVGIANNGEIAVFQGVRGSLLGIALHRQLEGSCPPGAANCEPIMINDLREGARDTVRNGITSQSLNDARATIARLRASQVLPECPDTSGTTTPSSPTSGAGPTTSSATSVNSTTPGDSSSTTSTTRTPTPGVDCRKVGS